MSQTHAGEIDGPPGYGWPKSQQRGEGVRMRARSWLTLRRGLTSIVCCAGLIGATASAAGASAHGARPAAASQCTPANTQIWLGLGIGGGTLGSTYYPLELSNVGHHACTLNGIPGVSAEGGGG